MGWKILTSTGAIKQTDPAGSTAPAYVATGLTGATAASRYAGATTSGPPNSGTFAVGDWVIDQGGAVWFCTAAGTPGTWVNEAISIPALRGEAGGSVIASGIGATVGSYICNMDSTVKVPGTLGNQVLSTFIYDTNIDAPPAGCKTQWMLEVNWTTNNTAPAITATWSMWQITGIGGAAGGYTESMAASLTGSLNVASTINAGALTGADSGWSDTGSSGSLATGNVYAFAFNNSGTFAASSALRWRMRLWRRFIHT